NGESMDVAPGSGHHVRVPMPAADYQKALIARYLSQDIPT
ncbi:Uncharacterized protease YegQ, partial [hydrothermal vent metagenome]